jgi:tRNA nucleotidyltransferase (CCA-adding enzyme)
MIDLEAPGAVRWICRTLEDAGYSTWAVGGAVRNRLAGRPAEDWDLTTRAEPKVVRRLFRRTVPIGVDHGTVGVLAHDGTMYELTTFRRDVETSGRHAVVAFAETLDEDLARRDFTINAVAWHPLDRMLHDPYGGAADLERRILRTVGDPAERFSEDYLRVLRALRFAGTFGLRVDPPTWRALVRAVPGMEVLSPERVREELEKVLSSPERPSAPLSLYAASSALSFLYPELEKQVGRPDRGGADRWSHLLRVVDRLAPGDLELRWAALLMGVGTRPEEPAEVDGGTEPDLPSMVAAAELLRRLRSSNARVDRVGTLVGWGSRFPAAEASDVALRRWLAGVGRGPLRDLLRIRLAIARVRELEGRPGERDRYLRLAPRLRALARSDVPLEVGELAFTGRDLIRMGQRPGPYFGDLLRHLLGRVIENPSLNRPELLAEEARVWLADRGEETRSHGGEDR